RPFLITGNDEAAADACHALEVSSSGRVAGAHRPPLDRLGELTVPDRPGAISRSAGSRSVDRPGPGRLGAGGDEAGDRLLCVGLTGGDGRDDRVGRDRTDLVDQAFEQTVAGFAHAQPARDGGSDRVRRFRAECIHVYVSCVLSASAVLIVSGSGPVFPPRSANVVATRSTRSYPRIVIRPVSRARSRSDRTAGVSAK